MKISVKKISVNQQYALKTNPSGHRIRALSVLPSGFFAEDNVVTVGDQYPNGRLVRGSRRTLLADSLRRRYIRVA